MDENGALQDGGLLLIRDGRIAQVGGTAPQGAERLAFPDGVLCAGLIDCAATLSASGDLAEPSSPLQPDLAAAASFDAHAEELSRAMRAGVTLFGLTPEDSNLIGGRIAVCSTGGASGPSVVGSGPLHLSLSALAFQPDREPTSRAGAIDRLRREFDAARAASQSVLGQFVAGRLSGVFSAPDGADVLSAIDLARPTSARIALRHTRDALEVAGVLAGKNIPVIVGPLSHGSSLRELRAAGWLASKEVPVAFTAGLPWHSPEGLRVVAGLAARHGLDPAIARRGLTRVAAEVLGVADRAGALRPGLRADVVIFSGDPLDLRSRVLLVVVEGRLMFSAAPPAKDAQKE